MRSRQALAALAIGCLVGLAASARLRSARHPGPPTGSRTLAALLNAQSFPEQTRLVRALLEELGPEDAQEELNHSGLPFTGEGHLVIHVVGNYLYEKFGAQGIRQCKPYFLGACFHGVLIHAIGASGPDVVFDLWPECRRRGLDVAGQCSHGVGHGLLAWNNYDLLGALRSCDDFARRADGFTAFNCYDGVFMENVWRVHGGHGPHMHGEHPQVVLPSTSDDLLSPCTDPQIPDRYLGACWANLASVLYQAFGGDLPRVAAVCNGVADPDLRQWCFNGFARQIHPLTAGKTTEAFRLCASAGSDTWETYCLVTVAEAAFSVGDKIGMPIEICSRLNRERTRCFAALVGLHALETSSDLGEACQPDTISDEGQARRCIGLGDLAEQRKELSPDETASAGPLREGAVTDDFHAFYTTPYVSPYMTPYHTPYMTPYRQPPYVTPHRPSHTPYPTPLYFPPYLTPGPPKRTTPYLTPYTPASPGGTPYVSPYPTPAPSGHGLEPPLWP